MDAPSAVVGLLRADQGPLQERVLLKDNAANLLREHIISGRLPSGTKLVEHTLSEALGISRMPIRDALLKLEEEGVVTTRVAGRFVVELSTQDVLELYQVRVVLERLAVQRATEHLSDDGRTVLHRWLGRMRDALAVRDQYGFVRADLEIHRAIWVEARNPYLRRALENLRGPMMIFISNSSINLDWDETLELHVDLVDCVVGGDVAAALAVMQRHMDSVIGEVDRDSGANRTLAT